MAKYNVTVDIRTADAGWKYKILNPDFGHICYFNKLLDNVASSVGILSITSKFTSITNIANFCN